MGRPLDATGVARFVRRMKRLVISCGFIVVAAIALPLLAQPAKSLPPLKDSVKPSRLAGAALNVVDIEKEKDFYLNVLGMKVVQRIPAQGALREYLLSFGTDSKDGPVLVLTRTDKVDPKVTDFGRVIFDVPNGEALARRAAEAGYPPRRIVDGSNTITDPEGHRIELFQSAPEPAGK
jgi:catechol 2,3-dioxygenase-like lactoylglutathione lyase family enzyme